jgi:hypothetical protein
MSLRWRKPDSNHRSLSGISPIRAVGAETDVGRRNGRSSTAGPMVRIRFPPLRVRSHQCPAAQPAHNPRLGGGLHTGWDVRRDGPARTGAPSPFFSVGLRCSPTSGELPNRLGRVDAASRRRDSTSCPLRRLLRHEVAHANWFDDYGFGQLLIGTELMLFFGLPSIIRSL